MSPRAPPAMTDLGLALVREARTMDQQSSRRRLTWAARQRVRSAYKEAAHLSVVLPSPRPREAMLPTCRRSHDNSIGTSPRSHTRWHLVHRLHDNSIGTRTFIGATSAKQQQQPVDAWSRAPLWQNSSTSRFMQHQDRPPFRQENPQADRGRNDVSLTGVVHSPSEGELLESP